MKSSTRVGRILLWVSVLLSIPVIAAALNNNRPPPPPARPAPARPAPSRPAPAPSRPSYNPPPSHPSYTPPSRPSYTPPSRPSNNPAPSRPYSPPSSGGGARPSSPSPSSPNPSSPSHSYTPGAPSGGSSSSPRSSSGATTYTPHTYTPGSSAGSGSAASHSSGSATVSGEGVKSANGATTYTPHASTGSSSTPAAPAATHGSSYTPAAPAATHGSSNTLAAPAATHGNSYTPAAPAAAHDNSSTPAAPAAAVGNSHTPAAPAAVGGNTNSPRNSSPGSAAGGGTHAVYSVPASSTVGKTGSGNSTLSAAGSQSVLHQVNTARSGLTGINKRSIPPGQVSVHPDKSLTVTATNGRNFNVRSNGTLASYSGHGQSATFHSDGRVASVHTSTMDIARGPHGQRTVISERPDHSRLVSTGAHSGYSQLSVAYHGHTYNQRTYVHGDHSFTRAYAGYGYRGLMFDNYLPLYSYDPWFYGWAYYPWGAPVGYGWGWEGSPWFAFYGGFFSPWAAYPSGAYWLTDYYLGQTLANGYQMEAPADGGEQGGGYAGDGAGAAGGDEAYAQADTPITPEIKQAIAEEVAQQLAYENAAAAQPDQAPSLDGLPQVLVANHLFVVNQGLNVATADGQQCGLSTGDVIKLVAAPPEGLATADLMVVSSRRGDCPAGLIVTLSLENLQEMQNNFRAQLDSGLQRLHAQQGQGGLPAAPYAAIAAPPRPVDAPPADNENVQALLDAQRQQADQAETGVTQAAFAGPQ
jgi:hypothetical protein